MWLWLQSIWHRLTGRAGASEVARAPVVAPAPVQQTIAPLAIEPDDPLLVYFQQAPGVVQLDELVLDSPALATLKAAGIQLAVPLINQGQLIGVLNVGARLSEQAYSGADRRLLHNLASQVAPVVRVAQLVQQQQLEARQRERIEQELRVARAIQETLLPRHLPDLPGWAVAAYWQPARAVGGDFYDFIGLPDGKLGIVIGDVTDKGVPAALVMASTRSILRGTAEHYTAPGQVLERVNNLLYPDMPPKMFVTCLYAIFEPATGRFWFANAGHNLPIQANHQGSTDLWARGMPLGLMPDMRYEEAETTLAPGDSILLYSDGLVEAHNPLREMFGFPRLRQFLAEHAQATAKIDALKLALAAFVGPAWEQEDDVTLVLIERQPLPALPGHHEDPAIEHGVEQVIATFTVASQPGNERTVTEQVAAAVASTLNLPQRTIDRLKTAVSEAVMNAMEHGNAYDADKPVEIEVRSTPQRLTIAIHDHGGGQPMPATVAPDLSAKLAGEQPPRGWGLFLIQHMVDEMRVRDEADRHTVELIFHLERLSASSGDQAGV
jgi:serine phosphatase RsbU (regulator of sigma subunit)/anti-sigma regulatory factor (Ser/Thr protein kinase)